MGTALVAIAAPTAQQCSAKLLQFCLELAFLVKSLALGEDLRGVIIFGLAFRFVMAVKFNKHMINFCMRAP